MGTVIVSQAGGAGSADARGLLLHQLLAIAFSHLAEGVPVVVGVEDGIAGLVHPWPRVDVADIGQLAEVVHERLAEGPVLVFPPWDKPENSQHGVGVRFGRVLPSEAVLLGCRPAGPGSVLAVMTPESTLTSERARRLRESLATYWQPAVVLYATGVVREAHPALRTAVVILRSRQRKSPVLRIFRLPDTPDPGAAEEDFRRLLAGRHDRGRFGYGIRDPLPAGESLQFERHDPAVLARRADLAGYGRVIPLGELFDLPAPGIHPLENRDSLCDAGDDGAVRVLAGRDIGRSGVIAPADDRSRWARVSQGKQLQAGDLILRRIYHPTDHGGLVLAEVTAEDLPVPRHLG
jgi:hypothetical protein